MTLPVLVLKKNEERRIKTGHPWVYSNEVDTKKSPLKNYTAGETVWVQDYRGKLLGTAYINPNCLICARFISRKSGTILDQSLITHRLKIALGLRQRFFSEPYYRLVYGESDGLPGLVVDRFDQTVVVQINTAGMEAQKQAIVAALEKAIKPSCIILRNDSPMRQTEGLEHYVETALGTAPEQLRIQENACHFEAPTLEGQKTGWFYDHRINRQAMQSLVKDKRVLDVFSYLGAWGIQAACAGASEVICVETSAKDCDWIEKNADLNKQDQVKVIQGDAFETLKALNQAQEKFDLIILDPPAFIKRKKDFKEGLNAYHRINQMAIQCLHKDSLLISASCSYHMKNEDLLGVLHQSARHLDRQAVIVAQGHQGPDHPIHPAISETAYLKSYTARILYDNSN